MNKIALNLTGIGKLCDKSRWTVQKWIRMGLPYIPDGTKHKMVMVSTLEKWLISRQVTAKI